MTLIIAGGVLGMIAGGIQLGVNILIDNNNNRKERLQKEREKETTMEKELLQPPAVTVDSLSTFMCRFQPLPCVTSPAG